MRPTKKRAASGSQARLSSLGKHTLLIDQKKGQHLVSTYANCLLIDFILVGTSAIGPGIGTNLPWRRAVWLIAL